MTSKIINYKSISDWNKDLDCYKKQSLNDKIGMKGDRSEIQDTFNYTPKGLNVPITRQKGSLRLKRGDTKLSTLAKTYSEFEHLTFILPFPNAMNLALIRTITGKVSLTEIRQSIRNIK